jgi:hypothetical protein
MLNYLLLKVNRPKLDFDFSRRTAFKVFFTYLMGWVIYGLAFYFLARGLLSSFELPLMVSMGSIVLAYILGLIAFFSPGGLGVRELILQSFLNPYLGAIGAGIVIAARIWSILIEFVVAGIALTIKFKAEDL